MPYYVVLADDWSAAIPACWVNVKNEEYRWPPDKIDVAKAIKNQQEPTEAWHELIYKTAYGPYDSYAVARSVEKESQYISTNDEAKFEQASKSVLPTKRSHKRKQNFSDTEDSTNETEAHVPKYANIPKPPSNYKTSTTDPIHSQNEEKKNNNNGIISNNCSLKNLNETQLDYGRERSALCSQSHYAKDSQLSPCFKMLTEGCENYEVPALNVINSFDLENIPMILDNEDVQDDIEVPRQLLAPPIIRQNDVFMRAENEDKKNHPQLRSSPRLFKSDAELKKETIQVADVSKAYKMKPRIINIVNISPQKKNKYGPINEKLTEPNKPTSPVFDDFESKNTREMLIIVNSKLDMLLNIITNSAKHGSLQETQKQSYDSLPNFPLVDIQALKTFDVLLKSNQKARQQFETKIRLLGGSNGEAHLKNVLRLCMTNGLAYEVTWTGPQSRAREKGKSKETLPLKSTKFTDIILTTIAAEHPKNTLSELSSSFMNWLQHAGDRLRYSEKKLNQK